MSVRDSDEEWGCCVTIKLFPYPLFVPHVNLDNTRLVFIAPEQPGYKWST